MLCEAKEMTKVIVPARMPGCAKKLAVRSCPVLSMINTSLPVLPVLLSRFCIGLPVSRSGLSLLWSKSISLPSPPLFISPSGRFGLSTIFCRKTDEIRIIFKWNQLIIDFNANKKTSKEYIYLKALLTCSLFLNIVFIYNFKSVYFVYTNVTMCVYMCECSPCCFRRLISV